MKKYLFFLFALATSLAITNAQTPIFINEIHYDNSGGDVNEGTEIAGPAGTDMTGWHIVYYNGNGGAMYGSDTLDTTIPDQQNGYGTIWTAHPASVQNGPDAIALVNASSTVIQFLSYEGDFTATDGPASGMTSTNIGITESSSTGTDQSMQLTGQGENYEDFMWVSNLTATNGSVNTVQIFGILPEPDNHVTSFMATALDFSTIQVSWTDAIGTNEASGYVVRASSVSYADITNPVDGTPLADDAVTINVRPGVQEAAFTGLSDNSTYYFKIYSFSNYTTNIDYKTDGTIPQAEAATPMAGDFILTEDFEAGLSWAAVSDTGDQVWEHYTSEGANGTTASARINGYSGGTQYNVDWLIAPPVNLDAFTGEVLNFYTEWQYGSQDADNYLKLLYSTDYSGDGMPQEATWSELAFTMGASNTFTKADDIDISGIAAPTVYFAFKYKSFNDARRWNVDEVVAIGTYAGDATAPVFNSGTPRADDVRENQFDLVVNLNEVGTVFYLVKNDGDPAPDIPTVRGADTLEILTANADFSTTIDTVSMSSGYDVYFVAIDSAGNAQASLSQIDVTTKGPREIEMTQPIGGETVYVGDTMMVKWTSSNIDSVTIYVDIFEGEGWFPVDDENEKIGADLGEFPVFVPLSAGVDSVKMLIADAEDFSVNDSSGVFYLTDTIKPMVELLLPMNKSAGVTLLPTLAIYFNEEVTAGTGNVSIHEDGGTLVEAIEVTGDQVEIEESEGYKAIIQLSNKLANETGYYVLVDAGTFVDYQGNVFAGILEDTTWTFTTMGVDLLISEYIDGSGSNKALEIYNATGSDVDLSDYKILLGSNGRTWEEAFDYPLANILKADSIFVICNSDAIDEIKVRSDSVGGVLNGITYFNGDDAIGLFRFIDGNWILIDAIGVGGVDPGTGWDVAGETEATADHTLIRKDFVMTGNPDWESSAGTNGFNSEWRVLEYDYYENLGLLSPPSNTEAEIDSFKLAEQTGPAVINSVGATVDIEVILGTDLSSLTPMIWISEGAKIDPPSGEPVDFSSGSELFTVTAENTITTKEWTVNVTEAEELSSEKKILSFILAEETKDAVIDTTAFTVTAEVEYGTDLSSLTPTITYSAGATISPESGVAQDFSGGPVTYTVTAQDASTQDWAVTVNEQQTIDVANLAALRAGAIDGTIYKVTGEVVLTFQQDDPNLKYIQDASAAIVIYDEDTIVTTSYNLGDGIVGITGTLNDYYGMLELFPLKDPGAANSTGNTVNPQTLTISEFRTNFENYEAEVVRLDSIELVDGGGTFTNGYNYDVFRGSDSTVVRIHFRKEGIGGTAIPELANVTGIAIWDWNEAKVSPRSTSDIEEVIIDNVASSYKHMDINFYPNPNGGQFSLEWNGDRAEDLNIEILSLNGKMVYRNTHYSVTSVREQINMDGCATGMYLLRVRTTDQISISKIVIQ